MANMITITGNLGRDPETRTAGDKTVTSFSIADSTYDYRAKKERTIWRNVEVWGRLGERCAEYLRKGMHATVIGEERLNVWEKNGEEHSRAVVSAQQVAWDRSVTASGNPIAGNDSPDDEVPF